MGTRPLRQYYDGVTIEVGDDLPLVEPWLRHRRRFLAELAELTDDQWKTTTRCTNWDARGVVSHLITVDGFFAMTLGGAHARTEPTMFIRGFNPSTGTDALVAPLQDLEPAVLHEQLSASTDALIATVEQFAGDDWDAPGEAPFGHVPARTIVGHAFWDSWLHERDILVPLGLEPEPESDEVLATLWYMLLAGGLQGGLLDDAEPVGPGPDAPIDATLRFVELAEDPLHVHIDTGVSVTRANGAAVVDVGSAVEVVETATGRASTDVFATLPPDVAAQLTRSMQIL